MGQIFSHLRGITHNAPLALSVGLQALDLLLPRDLLRDAALLPWILRHYLLEQDK